MLPARPFAALLLTLAAGAAMAAEPHKYSQQEFDRLAHAGKPVVVDIAADWCPTCKAQKPIIDRLSRDASLQEVTVLTVDFDADKATVRALKATSQSTLIAYRGGKELARSVGDTTPAGIEILFRMAMR